MITTRGSQSVHGGSLLGTVTEQGHIHASRYKTKLCRNYVVNGECPYEFRCMFAHGEHELRTMEMNLKDGLITEEAIKAFQRAPRSQNHSAASTPAAMSPSKPPQGGVRRFVHNPYSLSCAFAYVTEETGQTIPSAIQSPSLYDEEDKNGALVFAP